MTLLDMPITKSIFRCCRSYTSILFARMSLASFPVNTTPFWSCTSIPTNYPFIGAILANVSTFLSDIILGENKYVIRIIHLQYYFRLIFDIYNNIYFYFKLFYYGIIPKGILRYHIPKKNDRTFLTFRVLRHPVLS